MYIKVEDIYLFSDRNMGYTPILHLVGEIIQFNADKSIAYWFLHARETVEWSLIDSFKEDWKEISKEEWEAVKLKIIEDIRYEIR